MSISLAPITGTIFAGKSKDCGNGIREWVGKKHEVADEAIRAVFEWFMYQYTENEPSVAYEVRYTNCPYVLTMTKEK